MAPRDTAPDDEGIPPVRLGGTFDILPGAPAGEFRSPTAEAYRAVAAQRPGDSLVALICDGPVPCRHEAIEPMRSLRVDGLMTPLAAGVVDWQPRGRRSLALIFQSPPGNRVVDALSDTIAPVPEDELAEIVLPDLVAALRVAFSAGLTHRAIRPTNLFRRSGTDRRLVLGECLSAPPAFSQPVAWETIESGLADPAGRGSGSPPDDLYALGMTLAFLALGRDPTQGIDGPRVLADKIARGSFMAMLGGVRLPLRILEAVRGLLADDPRERWTLKELDHWMLGRRLSPKQFAPPKRAGRPLELDGAEHLTARSLASAFARDPAAAAALVKSGEFDGWLQRSLAEPERSAAVATALAAASESEGASSEARLMARIAMALDPAAPIRYGGMSATIDGIGAALAAAILSGAPATPIAEAIVARLPQFWFGVQNPPRLEAVSKVKAFDRMRIYIEDRRPGFGIERVLYELNPELHCLSPGIERDHVVEAGDLLQALERAAAGGGLAGPVIDRHVAAFIAARFKNVGNDWADELASGDPQRRALGTLQLLARLQAIRGPAAAPALSERLGRELPALVEQYHSRARRDRIRTSLAKLVAKGDLAAMLNLVASPNEQRRDAAGFRAARSEYAAIESALAALRDDTGLRPRQAAELGGRIGVMAAAALGAAAALCAIVGTR